MVTTEVAPLSPNPAVLPMHGGNETILLAEDEHALRRTIRRMLERLGYRVLEAPNVSVALELWKENRPEIRLLITDLAMPGNMSGTDLAQNALLENPALKVIFISGFSSETLRKDIAMKDGINFLTKPFSADRLAQVVRNCLDIITN